MTSVSIFPTIIEENNKIIMVKKQEYGMKNKKK